MYVTPSCYIGWHDRMRLGYKKVQAHVEPMGLSAQIGSDEIAGMSVDIVRNPALRHWIYLDLTP